MNDGVTPRAFTWDDVPALHALVARWQTHTGIRIHLGDMYWTLRATPSGDAMGSMWAWPVGRGGDLAAVAWFDGPESTDFILAPDAPHELLAAVLDRIEHERRRSGGATVSIVIRHGDADRMEELTSRGYDRGETGDVRLHRRLDAEPTAAPLPDGFAVRHVDGADDIERRVEVERASFGGAPTPEVWHDMIARLPEYRPELDLVVLAPDGSGAAAITCWFDSSSRHAEIEAVGTIPSMRQLGLGKALITEGLRRLSHLGATEVALYTNIGNVASLELYRSCGFEVVAQDYAYRRTL